MKPPIFLMILMSLWGARLAAQETILAITPILETNGVKAGQAARVALQVRFFDNWHINSNQPLDEFVIPTEIRPDPNRNLKVSAVLFPAHTLKRFAFSDDQLAVFEKQITICMELQIDKRVKSPLQLAGRLYYQACDDLRCLAPQETAFQIDLPLLAEDEAMIAVNAAAFTGFSRGESTASGLFEVRDSIARRGFLLTLILIFLGGLALNLTPCVYPLIPITMSYFGGQSGSRRHRLLMAVLYVLGIAIVNSSLGTLAALSGAMLGGAIAHPVVVIGIAIILVALALSMFGLYEFTLPNFLTNLAGSSRGGMIGAFIMGLTMGIIAAPCIGPFVLGLLTYVASTGNPWLGFFLFFTLSLGLGAPFLLLAFFASQIDQLPRAGDWMVGVRTLFGLILIGMAIYFLRLLIPAPIYYWLLPIYIIACGIYLILINRQGENTPIFRRFIQITGITAIIIGTWLVRPSAASAEFLEWNPYSPSAYQIARKSNQPILIDFYADWCIPCKELDAITFRHPTVIDLARLTIRFKVDLTSTVDDSVHALKERLAVKGVPTIVYIARNGEEINALRTIGFESPEVFAAKLRRLLQISNN